MRRPVCGAKRRILVTGSRGKSSLVRLITAGLIASGLDARGRITGVIPRELGPHGEKRIVRNSPAHVEEMRWWLKRLPEDIDAAVMENSAINPDLQHLAAEWLSPTLTVWTNARPDHEEAWGPGHISAIESLIRGIPDGGTLLLGAEPSASALLRELLQRRKGGVVFMSSGVSGYIASNLALASRALEIMGLHGKKAAYAMQNLEPDIADFRIFTLGETPSIYLASAFSANDPLSAEILFASTGWLEKETSVLYSDRADRGQRLKSFGPFLGRQWREVRLIREKENLEDIKNWIYGKKDDDRKIFGCGNVKGAPLELLCELIGLAELT